MHVKLYIKLLLFVFVYNVLFICVPIFRHCILDEVDRMLDMGFQDSVEEILAGSYQSGSKKINHRFDGLRVVSEQPSNLFFLRYICYLPFGTAVLAIFFRALHYGRGMFLPVRPDLNGK